MDLANDIFCRGDRLYPLLCRLCHNILGLSLVVSRMRCTASRVLNALCSVIFLLRNQMPGVRMSRNMERNDIRDLRINKIQFLREKAGAASLLSQKLGFYFLASPLVQRRGFLLILRRTGFLLAGTGALGDWLTNALNPVGTGGVGLQKLWGDRRTFQLFQEVDERLGRIACRL